MRKRTMAKGGVIAVLIVAVATWLSGLFEGVGFGPGGIGIESGTQVNTQPVAPPAESEQVSQIDEEDGAEFPAEIRVLEVVVAGNGYEIRREVDGDVRFQSIDLPRLKELARRTTGNEEGIRVLIYRRESALPQAEMTLEEALREAGVEESAVVRREGLLPARGR